MLLGKKNDIQELYRLASELVGQVCWKVNFGYGEELMLHFGERISYPQPVMKLKEKGSWILGTRATIWQIQDNSAIDCERLDLNELVQILIGKKVSAIEIEPITRKTSIEFDNTKLMLLPEIQADDDLPDWEIFRPDGMVLQGDRLWSLVRG